MAKKEANIDEFIELRIQGKTFEEISKKLNVSKQSLINWNKDDDVKNTISIAKLAKYESLIKSYELDRMAKIKRFAELSNRINEELSKRDLSEIPTEKLFNLLGLNDKKLYDLIPVRTFQKPSMSNLFDKNPDFRFNPLD